jgi:hypothetical protein
MAQGVPCYSRQAEFLARRSQMTLQKVFLANQTSRFNTLVMLILLVGGLGLMARALRPQVAAKSE